MPLSKRTKTVYNPETGNNDNVEEMFEVASPNDISYEKGQPKKHHYLYFESGDLVIQASHFTSQR
jgi:hypothetical protein